MAEEKIMNTEKDFVEESGDPENIAQKTYEGIMNEEEKQILENIMSSDLEETVLEMMDGRSCGGECNGEHDCDCENACCSNEEKDDTNEIIINMSDGSGYVIDADTIDWDEMINDLPQMKTNVNVLRKMVFDIVTCAVDKREELIDVMQQPLDDFASGWLKTELNYDTLREDITPYEKLLIGCFDMINGVETMIHYTEMKMLLKVKNDFSLGIDASDFEKHAIDFANFFSNLDEESNDINNQILENDKNIQNEMHEYCYDAGTFEGDDL